MNKLLVKLVGNISVLCGLLAIVKWFDFIASSKLDIIFNNINDIFYLVSFLVYMCLIFGGFMILRNKEIGYIITTISYIMQLFYVYSSDFLYDLTAGFSTWIYVYNYSLVEFKNVIGTYFAFDTNYNAVDTIIGVNIFAIIAILILVTNIKLSKSSNKFQDKNHNYSDKNEKKNAIYSSREFIR